MLRTLTPVLALVLSSTIVLGEETTEPQFSPDALGQLGVDVDGLMSRAKRDASDLERGFQVQEPADLSDLTPGLEELQKRARNDPRVRALLGLTEEGTSGADPKPNYDTAKILVFASFAMPAPSLRQIMEDAERYQAQVVMRGFVDNSVFKTEAALAEVFGDVSDAKGFAIDPTLFRRFNVQAVPIYVVLNGPLDACESPGCGEDAPPLHDRVSGNIELHAALELVARANGDAQVVAQALLASGLVTQPHQAHAGGTP